MALDLDNGSTYLSLALVGVGLGLLGKGLLQMHHQEGSSTSLSPIDARRRAYQIGRWTGDAQGDAYVDAFGLWQDILRSRRDAWAVILRSDVRAHGDDTGPLSESEAEEAFLRGLYGEDEQLVLSFQPHDPAGSTRR